MARHSLGETSKTPPRTNRRVASAMATARNPGDGSQRLLNYKHELIARHVAVKGMSHAEAWRVVYDVEGKAPDKRAWSEGSRICCKNEAVALRIQYLTDQAILRDVESVATSREWVEEQMVKTYIDASSDGVWAAAVKALELLGIDKGMFVRRTSVQKSSAPIEAGNREELVEQFVQLARDAFGPIDTKLLRAAFAKAVSTSTAAIEAPKVEDADVIGEPVGNA